MLTILQGDVIEQLRTLPDESVHCCVTSPPYWGLRDYGTGQWEGGDKGCDHKTGRFERGGLSSKQASNNGSGGDEASSECPKCGAKRIDSQLGLEKTPEEYVAKMVAVFREVRRVLRKDGTLWLNLGDSYWSDTLSRKDVVESMWGNRPASNLDNGRDSIPSNNRRGGLGKRPDGLKPKDLCGIPWRVAFALQADGWWLRSDIIWAKPNPMPESVTDRPTKAHEYIFLLTKSANYFYDAEAIKEANSYNSHPGRNDGADSPVRSQLIGKANNNGQGGLGACNDPSNGRNKRTVWTVATAPYPEAHFATYPPDLIKPCILAGTSAKGCCAKCGSPWERIVESPSYERNHTDPKKLGTLEHHQSRGGGGNEGMIRSGKHYADFRAEHPIKTIGWQPTCGCITPLGGEFPIKSCTILDPFAGSGTTGAVALELGREAILIELNPKYVELIKTRCNVTPGLQLA